MHDCTNGHTLASWAGYQCSEGIGSAGAVICTLKLSSWHRLIRNKWHEVEHSVGSKGTRIALIQHLLLSAYHQLLASQLSSLVLYIFQKGRTIALDQSLWRPSKILHWHWVGDLGLNASVSRCICFSARGASNPKDLSNCWLKRELCCLRGLSIHPNNLSRPSSMDLKWLMNQREPT